MKPPPRFRPGSPEDWLAHARSDLNLAQLARGSADVLPEQVGFHAQQAAEKALKAVLLVRGIAFPRVHDLEVLLDLAKRSKLNPPAELADLGSLTPYAVESRYPGYREEITSDDVDEAIALAEGAVAWATAQIPTQRTAP